MIFAGVNGLSGRTSPSTRSALRGGFLADAARATMQPPGRDPQRSGALDDEIWNDRAEDDPRISSPRASRERSAFGRRNSPTDQTEARACRASRTSRNRISTVKATQQDHPRHEDGGRGQAAPRAGAWPRRPAPMRSAWSACSAISQAAWDRGPETMTRRAIAGRQPGRTDQTHLFVVRRPSAACAAPSTARSVRDWCATTDVADPGGPGQNGQEVKILCVGRKATTISCVASSARSSRPMRTCDVKPCACCSTDADRDRAAASLHAVRSTDKFDVCTSIFYN